MGAACTVDHNVEEYGTSCASNSATRPKLSSVHLKPTNTNSDAHLLLHTDDGHTMASQDDRRSDQVLSVEYMTRATNHSHSTSQSNSGGGGDWRISEDLDSGHLPQSCWSERHVRAPNPSTVAVARELGSSIEQQLIRAAYPSQLSCGTADDDDDDDVLCDRDDDPPMIADEPGGHIVRLPMWKKRHSNPANPSIHSARKSVVSFSECVSVHYDAPPVDDAAADGDQPHVECEDADDEDRHSCLSFDFSTHTPAGAAPVAAAAASTSTTGSLSRTGDPNVMAHHHQSQQLMHLQQHQGDDDDDRHSSGFTSPTIPSVTSSATHPTVNPQTPLARLQTMLQRSTGAASDSVSVTTLFPTLHTSVTAGDAMSTCSSRQAQVVVVHLVDSTSHRIQLARPRI